MAIITVIKSKKLWWLGHGSIGDKGIWWLKIYPQTGTDSGSGTFCISNTPQTMGNA